MLGKQQQQEQNNPLMLNYLDNTEWKAKLIGECSFKFSFSRTMAATTGRHKHILTTHERKQMRSGSVLLFVHRDHTGSRGRPPTLSHSSRSLQTNAVGDRTFNLAVLTDKGPDCQLSKKLQAVKIIRSIISREPPEVTGCHVWPTR